MAIKNNLKNLLTLTGILLRCVHNNKEYMKTNTKISNERTYGVLGADYKLPDTGETYKKGGKYDARNITLDGYIITLGHGWNAVIPRNLFTKFVHKWTETTISGDTITTVLKSKDVTALWINHFKALEKNIAVATKKEEIRTLKRKIANLRKAIAEIKAGKLEKLIEELNTAKAELELSTL